MCDSNFPVRNCSVCARKRSYISYVGLYKLYVGERMAPTIDLREMFGLCTFDSLYSLGRRKFVDFNVDLFLLGMLFFFIRFLICAIVL